MENKTNNDKNLNFEKLGQMQRVEAVLDRWLYLQKIIKEEITLNEISIF